MNTYEAGATRPTEAIGALLATLFPRRRAAAVELLPDGVCNLSHKVSFDTGETVVLRVFGRDPTTCQREVELLRHVRETVPVPEVLDAYPQGLGAVGPFLITRFVEGITFRRLRATRDAEAIAEAAASVGETLAAIGQYVYDRRGRLGAGPSASDPFVNGPDAIPELVDTCLASPTLRGRLEGPTRDGVRRAVWSRAPELARLRDVRSLAHRDFNSRNVIVRPECGRWQVAAILDWEYAASGSALFDVGTFLRYETEVSPSREPHFSRGYERRGGRLPNDWRNLARLVDLASLCELLTEPDVPTAIVAEVCGLVRATIRPR